MLRPTAAGSMASSKTSRARPCQRGSPDSWYVRRGSRAGPHPVVGTERVAQTAKARSFVGTSLDGIMGSIGQVARRAGVVRKVADLGGSYFGWAQDSIDP